MKLMLTLLAATVAIAFALPEDAAAQSRGARAKKAQKQVRYVQRPASIGHNGLCQRDTGTPTSSLNFRNRCDTEEFWNRMQERGGFGRR